MKLNLVYRYNNRAQKCSISLGENISNELFDLSFTERDKGFKSYEGNLDFKREITILDYHVELEGIYNKDSKIYLNGWQTWTESREFSIDEIPQKLSSIANFLLKTYGDYTFTDYKNSFNSWSYSYTRLNDEYTLYGALKERDGFLRISHYPQQKKIKIVKDATGLTKKEGSLSLAFGVFQGAESLVFDRYFSYLGFPIKEQSRVIGWTSWYNYYTNISEEIIMSNLKAFRDKEIPIEIFQIDDGYQRHVGDWLDIKDNFPNGMKYIADNIKDSGYKAGLWLAPFVCTKRSNIYKKHYNWVAKDKLGNPIKAGFTPLWGGYFYLLDFYNEDFRKYLRTVFSTVFDKWQFDMVKLDFLYAITLLKHQGKTKGEMMFEAMDFLRELAGDKLILGCGVPLTAAYGITDFCRIGCDVGLSWEDKLLKLVNYRERVSTINSLVSTVGRRHLNKRVFLNDPDVFILREKNQKMSIGERKVLLYLNMLLGGLIFTSDHIGEYSDEEMSLYLDSLKYKDAKVLTVVEDENIYLEVDREGVTELFVFNLKDRVNFVNLPPNLKGKYTITQDKINPRRLAILYIV